MNTILSFLVITSAIDTPVAMPRANIPNFLTLDDMATKMASAPRLIWWSSARGSNDYNPEFQAICTL